LITVLAIGAGACNSESEEAAINLEVTSPTSLSEIDTTDTTVSLAGKASSDEGILQVSWVNDRGSEGIVDGTESWHATAIPLELGDNTVTISAEDAVGKST